MFNHAKLDVNQFDEIVMIFRGPGRKKIFVIGYIAIFGLLSGWVHRTGLQSNSKAVIIEYGLKSRWTFCPFRYLRRGHSGDTGWRSSNRRLKGFIAAYGIAKGDVEDHKGWES
jgi:hypothetical protein